MLRGLLIVVVPLGMAVLVSEEASAQVSAVVKASEPIHEGQTVVVARPGVRLMMSQQIVAELPRGTRVKVTQVEGNWLGSHVVYTGVPRSGWLSMADVRLAADDLPDDPMVLAALRQLGAQVELDSEGRAKTVTLDDCKNVQTGIAWLPTLVNLRQLHCCRTSLDDAALASLVVLQKLEVLDLRNTKCGDAGMRYVGQLIGLKELWLSDTLVTDAGLEYLRPLVQLNTLDLGSTKVTDAGLASLRGMPALESLWLSGTPITDTGVGRLRVLKRLQVLMLKGTAVSRNAAQQIRRDLPNLVIDQ